MIRFKIIYLADIMNIYSSFSNDMGLVTRKPDFCVMQTIMVQTRLCIHAVWSVPLLSVLWKV